MFPASRTGSCPSAEPADQLAARQQKLRCCSSSSPAASPCRCRVRRSPRRPCGWAQSAPAGQEKQRSAAHHAASAPARLLPPAEARPLVPCPRPPPGRQPPAPLTPCLLRSSVERGALISFLRRLEGAVKCACGGAWGVLSAHCILPEAPQRSGRARGLDSAGSGMGLAPARRPELLDCCTLHHCGVRAPSAAATAHVHSAGRRITLRHRRLEELTVLLNFILPPRSERGRGRRGRGLHCTLKP